MRVDYNTKKEAGNVFWELNKPNGEIKEFELYIHNKHACTILVQNSIAVFKGVSGKEYTSSDISFMEVLRGLEKVIVLS